MTVPEYGRVDLHNLTLNLTSPQLGQQITATLNAQASYGNVQKPVQAKLVVDGALGKQLADHVVLNVEALPVALADVFAGTEGKLVRTLGETLTAQLEMTPREDDVLAFTGSVESPQLAGPVQGNWDRKAQQGELSTPEPIRATVTQAAVDAWLGKRVSWELVQPAPMQLDLKKLQLALREPADKKQQSFLARIDPKNTSIAAELLLPQLAIRDPNTGNGVRVQNGKVSIPAKSLNEVLEMLITLTVDDLAHEGQGGAIQTPQTPQTLPATQGATQPRSDAAGTIESHIAISDLIGADGMIQPSGAHITSKATVKNAPSSLITLLYEQGQPIAAILGPRMNAQAQVDYQHGKASEASFDFNSSHATGSVAATMDPQGQVHLRKPANVQVQVTPDATQVMLRRFNPLLAGAVSAAAPIELSVSEQAFTMPLEPFNWQQVQAKGRLAIPKFTLQAGTFIDPLVQFLRTRNVLSSDALYEQVSVPAVDFAIDKGVLRYDQMSVQLADNLVFNFAGGVNLANGNLMGMKLTLQGEALPEEVRGLTLPMTGTIQQPKLDLDQLPKAMLRQGIEQGIRQGLEDLIRGGDKKK